MKVIFENKFEFTEDQLNIPFMINEILIGFVSEINNDTFTVNIFDKHIGCEMIDGRCTAIYLSVKQQEEWNLNKR